MIVNSGGLIEGAGSFTGALTLNAGAVVIADAHLTTGAITMNGGASYYWPISDATGTAGVNNGLISLGGGLSLSASSLNPITIKLFTFAGSTLGGPAANFDPNANYSWSLTSGATSLSGFAPNEFVVDTTAFTNGFNGTFGLTNAGNDLVLNYTASAIPEPSNYAAILGGLMLGAMWWRRQRTHRN